MFLASLNRLDNIILFLSIADRSTSILFSYVEHGIIDKLSNGVG